MPNESLTERVSRPAAELRRAYGQFATGVCIVSSRALPDTGAPFAITVNSFATVSLAPPMISWCVQKDSTSYPLWLDSDDFAVSILNSRQAALCEQFAIRGNHLIHDLAPFQQSALGNPVVREALATFECKVNNVHDAGDHSIIVADVLDFSSDERHAPLTYFRGAIDA
ncbi:MAG: flavin reductase family protein [Pseudomonadota bacterium]